MVTGKQIVIDLASRGLKDGTRYDWSLSCDCNCGNLFRAAGLGFMDMLCSRPLRLAWEEAISSPTWEYSRVKIVMSQLGFSDRELSELEMLSNPLIRRRAGLPPFDSNFPDYQKRECAIAYMDAWIDLLNEQAAIDASASQVLPPSPLRREEERCGEVVGVG